MGFIKIFLYKWEVFKVLWDQYEGNQTRDNWKSGFKRKVGENDEAVIKIKKLFSEICDISNQIRFGGVNISIVAKLSEKVWDSYKLADIVRCVER